MEHFARVIGIMGVLGLFQVLEGDLSHARLVSLPNGPSLSHCFKFFLRIICHVGLEKSS